jgi:hypothetical protein
MKLLVCCVVALVGCCFTVLSIRADGDSHLWSERYGDSDDQLGWSIAVDGAENAFLSGTFLGTVDFGGGPLTSMGGWDIFLAKFNRSGDHIWSQRFGDLNDQVIEAVAADGAGNPVILGTFAGTVDFGGGPLISESDGDVFLAKFNPEGNHFWSKAFGEASPKLAVSLTTDELILAGGFDGTVDFGGGPLMSMGGLDVFLAMLDPDGNHIWSERFGASGDQIARTVAVSDSGDVFFAGIFADTLDFGLGGLISQSGSDLFVAKRKKYGPITIRKRIDKATPLLYKALTLEETETIQSPILTGTFTFGDTLDFGGGPLVCQGEEDIYLVEFDHELNHIWSKAFGDPGSRQTVTGITVDGADVILTGSFEGSVDFGGGLMTSAGAKDIFLAKFDPDGNHLWSNRFGDQEDQQGQSVAAGEPGDFRLTGWFEGTVDLGGDPLTSAGAKDIFVAAFGSLPTPVLLSSVSVREVDLSVELSWITLSDVGIERFDVYRSTNPLAEGSQKVATLEADSREQSFRDESVCPGETYYYWIHIWDTTGGDSRFGPFNITFVGSEVPSILSGYPNPVREQATIRFYVPTPSDAVLRIYGPTGQLVRSMGAMDFSSGIHSLVWDRRDQEGDLVAGGAYFYSICVGGIELTGRKLIVTK